jgi:hypothetical protein
MIRFNSNPRLTHLLALKSDAVEEYTNAKIAHRKAVEALPETEILKEAESKYNKAVIAFLKYHKKLNPDT